MFRNLLISMALHPALCIGFGGGLGAVSRYYLSGWIQKTSASLFPYGTLAVNLLGCFLIGLAVAWIQSPHAPREEYRWLLMVGFLGGFTTFSTFGLETFTLLNQKEYTFMFGNLLLSNILGVCLVFIGFRLSQKWFGV